MKTFAGIVLIIVVFAAAAYSQHAPYPAPRARRANSVRNAFVGSWGPFDVGIYKAGGGFRADSLNRFGNDFNEVHIDTLRYVNLPADLKLNAEDRDPYDYPSNHPAPRDTVLGGDHEKYDDILILEPHQLVDAFNCASYMRFEFERHHREKDSLEYPGFYNHGTASGAVSLTGRNSTDATAEPCFWIVGSSRASDRDTTCLKLKAGTDAAGIFDDSLWHPQFINSNNNSPVRYFTGGFYNKRLLLRFRVRVDDSVNTALKPVLFIMHTKFQQLDSSLVNREDTFRVDSKFNNIKIGFDTIERRFIMPLKTVDGKLVDNTKAIFFSFEWPGTISMTADWMEVMTAHCDSTNADSLMLYGTPNGFPEAAAYSAEDFLAQTTPALDTLINRIVNAYSGHIDYLRIGDEFGLAAALPYQRLVQRVRALSHDSIEVTEFTQDSTASIFGIGLPNQQGVMFEGVRKGILDSSRYADPKMMMYDLYAFFDYNALPKRTTAATDTGILAWEKKYAPRYELNLRQGNSSYRGHYTRINYLKQYQDTMYLYYLQWNREARRLTERNPGMHYGLTWGAGNGAEVFIHSSSTGDSCLIYGGSYRIPTGAEMKEAGHLAMSCGAKGLILYFLGNAADNVPSQNGGIMSDHGFHDTNYHTFTIDKITQSLWMGWKERYDSVRSVNPILIKYGTTLIDDTCIGDWTAAELHNYPLRDSLPFRDTIATLDDSFRKDAFKINHSSDNSPDTANRTFVHISMWLDTTSAAKVTHSDTLLYITNMRTDDSYDTTEVPTTIDRRFITMKMKGKHFIVDVLDTALFLDTGRIRTPFVKGGDSLRIQLLPGDGILVRLFDGDTMHVAVNYPQGGQDFNNYGGIKFDKHLLGTKASFSGYRVPSTSHTLVGIRSVDTVSLWQDSLLYVKVENVDSTRKGHWRNQNWTEQSTPTPSTIFSFKKKLVPAGSGIRDPQISTDSLAHNIVIKTDLEGQSSNGKIRFKDPFLVDSATLLNVYDTLPKGSPFLPHVLNANRGLGVDSEHYGGIFLEQNIFRLDSIPIYSVNAYNILKSGTFQAQDTGLPSPGDWVFLHWVSNDDVDPSDIAPWTENPMDMNGNDYPLINFNKRSEAVFVRDSAEYHARYKAHMTAFGGPADPGFAMNNQRKLCYLYSDTLLRRWYRIIYASAGRIFTATGFRTGLGNSDIRWNQEQLLSEWDDPRAEYPALGLHRDTVLSDTSIHYVYQTTKDDGTSDIKIGSLVNGDPVIYADLDQDPDGGSDVGTAEATPVIASVETPYAPLDVTAWASPHGIVVKAIGRLEASDGSSVRTDSSSGNPEFHFGDSTAKHPTIWMDTCFVCGLDSSVHLVTLAWQQDTLIHDLHGARHKPNNDSTFTDIFVVQFDVRYGKRDSLAPYIYFRQHSGASLSPLDVSFMLKTLSWDNRNPCISGASYDTNSKLLRIAYETKAYNGLTEQGISVVHKRTGPPWKYTKLFLTADTLLDQYWKPSIEVSRYHDNAGVNTPVQNYYSLAYERLNGSSTEHWGMDSANQRLAPITTGSVSNPQLAVVRESVDSDTYRIGLATTGAPRILVPGYTGLYKAGGIDTLWSYHSITEADSAKDFFIDHCIGELAVDDGTTKTELELAERPEDDVIDSNHAAEYFMQSENFTLPESGSFDYFLWIRTSGDSLYRTKFDTTKFALDFFDTTGSYICRLDSVVICDSVPHIAGTMRTVTVSRDNSMRGYVKFRRLTQNLTTECSQWEPIITRRRLSNGSAYKRTSKIYSMQPDDILFTAEPNPSRGDVTVTFGMPNDGEVTIDAYNQLGLQVAEICHGRQFHAGLQKLIWHTDHIPSGFYYLHLRYGNSQKVVRVIYVR